LLDFCAFAPSLRQIFPVSPRFRVFVAVYAQILRFSTFYRIVFHIFTVVCPRFFARLESLKKFFVASNFSFFDFREILLLFCKIRISIRADFLSFLAYLAVR